MGVAGDLVHLAALYGYTDKRQHGYLPYYERHLGPRRLRTEVAYEIGVGRGGSLRMWRDYLVRSSIVGIDIEPKDVDLGPRVTFEQADQSSRTDLQRVVDRHGPPTVVIDDGSHVGSHIHASFDFLWPLLPAGGLYVVEDLSSSYGVKWEGGHPAPPTSGVGLVLTLVDATQALDSTFRRHPDWATAPTPRHQGVAAVHTYPGIAFIEKVSQP
jgi:hypothetical protein